MTTADKATAVERGENGWFFDFKCEDISELYDVFTQLVNDAYASKGGHNTGFSPKTTGLIRVCSSSEDVSPETIIAFIGYNKSGRPGGRYICENKNFPNYKQAVEELCKLHIERNKLTCFIEASEAIEHYCTKHNGDVIPNIYVHIVIGCNDNTIQKESDGCHYVRSFNAITKETKKRELRKVMFGFGSAKAYNTIKSILQKGFENTAVDGYELFKQQALKILRKQQEEWKNKNKKNEDFRHCFKRYIKEGGEYILEESETDLDFIASICMQYFNNFMEFYDDGVREFPKEVIDKIKELMDIYLLAEEDEEMAMREVDFCNAMLENVTELELIQLD